LEVISVNYNLFGFYFKYQSAKTNCFGTFFCRNVKGIVFFQMKNQSNENYKDLTAIEINIFFKTQRNTKLCDPCKT